MVLAVADPFRSASLQVLILLTAALLLLVALLLGINKITFFSREAPGVSDRFQPILSLPFVIAGSSFGINVHDH